MLIWRGWVEYIWLISSIFCARLSLRKMTSLSLSLWIGSIGLQRTHLCSSYSIDSCFDIKKLSYGGLQARECDTRVTFVNEIWTARIMCPYIKIRYSVKKISKLVSSNSVAATQTIFIFLNYIYIFEHHTSNCISHYYFLCIPQIFSWYWEIWGFLNVFMTRW